MFSLHTLIHLLSSALGEASMVITYDSTNRGKVRASTNHRASNIYRASFLYGIRSWASSGIESL